MLQFHCRALALASVLCVGSSAMAAEGSTEIRPCDVYQLVTQLRGELKLVQLELGRPAVVQPAFTVANATPRNVYFQACELQRKAARLCRELKAVAVPPDPAAEPPLRPSHVHAVVTSAIRQLWSIKQVLKIPETVAMTDVDPSKTTTDVLMAVAWANRQLNHVLSHPVRPRDVYQQVTHAVRLVEALGERIGVDTVSEEPPFERRRQPENVHARLFQCYDALTAVAKKLGHQTMTASTTKQLSDGIEPGDVLDVAILLVSELEFLRESVGARTPRQHVYPGRILPSHVFQRAGQLQTALERLCAAGNSR